MIHKQTSSQLFETSNTLTQHPILDGRYRRQIQEILNENIIITMENFSEYTEAIHSKDIGMQHWAVSGIRKLLVSQIPPIQSVINVDLVPALIQFIKREDYPQLQLQACWSLAIISSGTQKQCHLVCHLVGSMNAIPLLLDLLQSEFASIAEQVFRVINNIAAIYPSPSKYLIIKEKGVHKIVNYMKTIFDENILKYCYRILVNICKERPQPQYQLIQEAIPALCQVVINKKIKDKKIQQDCLRAISCHSSNKQAKQEIFKSGLISLLVLFLNKESSILVSSLTILCNITENYQNGVNLLFSLNIISYLLPQIDHNNQIIKYLKFRLLCNLTKGNMTQIESIITNQDIIKKCLCSIQVPFTSVDWKALVFLAQLSSKSQSKQLYIQLNQSRIIQNAVEMLRIFTTKKQKMSLQILQSIDLLLKFCKKFNDSKHESFHSRLIAAGGEDILNKLKIYRCEIVVSKVIEIQAQLEL